MYHVYIAGMELPVTPSKITATINNQNETVNLINEGEVNILKQPGLTSFSVPILLPAMPYTFSNNSIDIATMLAHLESLKVEKAVFPFIVSRVTPGGQLLHDTSLNVSLEDYNIVDDAKEGMDTTVTANFLQYRDWGAKTVKIKQGSTTGSLVSAGVSAGGKQPAKSYTVQEGDTLYNICQTQLGNGEKYLEVAKKNGISNPSIISAGQVIVF